MAPFKLGFSKMSKSRSNGSKVSRGNSVESDEPSQQQQQQHHHHHHHQQQLNYSNLQTLTGTTSRPETPGTEAATSFPDSPPPSYQHVLEETRQRRSTTNPDFVDDESQERAAEERKRNERRENSVEERTESRRKQIVVIERSPSGGCPGGGGGRPPARGREIIHKSSKELYKAVAKEWGITCKMSDQCRCFDCQSHYFDCEYENDEQGKTDGGLGAGTPMFIADVIHGTACVLL